MPMDLPPTPPAIVMQSNQMIYVQRESDRSTILLLGVVVEGDEAEVAKVEAAAAALKIEALRISPRDGGAVATMFTFPPEGSRYDELTFYHHVRDGDYAKVGVKVMVVTLKKARDIRRLPDDAEVLPTKAIREVKKR